MYRRPSVVPIEPKARSVDNTDPGLPDWKEALTARRPSRCAGIARLPSACNLSAHRYEGNMGRPVSAREELTREGSARSNVFSSKKQGSNPGSLEEKSMSPLQRRCLCSTAIPIALGFGFAAVPASGTDRKSTRQLQSLMRNSYA